MSDMLEASHSHIERLEDGLTLFKQFLNNVIDNDLPKLQLQATNIREEILKLLN